MHIGLQFLPSLPLVGLAVSLGMNELGSWPLLYLCTVQPLFYALYAKGLLPFWQSLPLCKVVIPQGMSAEKRTMLSNTRVASHCRSPLTNRCSFMNPSSLSSLSRMAACSARSSDFGSIAAVHNLELQRHLSRRTAAALMNGSEEERQTKLEIRLGGRRTDGGGRQTLRQGPQ